LKARIEGLSPLTWPTKAIEPVHTAPEVRLQRLDDEMEVIRHQHPGRDRPSKPSRRRAEEGEEGSAVAIGAEDVASLIAA
jgi:hypothetical protein